MAGGATQPHGHPGANDLFIFEGIAFDPTVAPGLDRPVGWRVGLADGSAAWDKFGPNPTDWGPVGTGSGTTVPSARNAIDARAALSIGTSNFKSQEFWVAKNELVIYINTGTRGIFISSDDYGGALHFGTSGTAGTLVFLRPSVAGPQSGVIATMPTTFPLLQKPLDPTKPWHAAALANLTGGFDSQWPLLITSGTTTPASLSVGLRYDGTSLKIRTWGSTVFVDYDTGFVDDGHDHLFELGFNGAKLRCWIDGILKTDGNTDDGQTSFADVPGNMSWIACGQDNTGHNVNNLMDICALFLMTPLVTR